MIRYPSFGAESRLSSSQDDGLSLDLIGENRLEMSDILPCFSLWGVGKGGMRGIPDHVTVM